MDIKLKVCGMREPGNILEVSRLQPDYMGFIFYAGTPRYVGDGFSIPEDFPPAIRRVGVFVNERSDEILRQVEKHKLDFVQLHGGESAQQCAEIQAHGIGVIKVFSINGATDFAVTEPYSGCADFFLFDTKGKYYGGNARAFDWQVLHAYDQQVPFFLSGGITPENAAGIGALKGLNLEAIDVNSGVEISPALKDAGKIQAIRSILLDDADRP